MAENENIGNSAGAARNFAEQLDPKDVQSVSSNGVSVTMRSAADKKAELELEAARKFNPFNTMFRADKWSPMHK